MVASWISEGKIKIEDEELICELTIENKYQIIKSVYASSFFTLEEKQALRKIIFENDASDKGKSVQQLLDYSLPDAELKATLWAELTNLESTTPLLTKIIQI
jgi:hypothetical protein